MSLKDKFLPLFRYSKVVFNCQVNLTSNKKIPGGRVQILLKTDQDVQLIKLLGTINNEKQNISWVSTIPGKRSSQSIKIPNNISKIDAESPDGNKIELSELSITAIGSIQHTYLKFLKPVIKNPKLLPLLLSKFKILFTPSGIAKLRNKFRNLEQNEEYQVWIKKYDQITAADYPDFKGVKISVIVPTYNTDLKILRKTINSVINQYYSNWELCLVDDNSKNQKEIELLFKEYNDPRLKYLLRTENGHISKATNDGIEIATGDYFAFLDHDDELREHALHLVASEIKNNSNLKFIYTDEDKITEDGNRCYPFFKTDYNHELLLQQNYLCHLCVYDSQLVRSVKGLRHEFNGAQDWDLALRIIDSIDENQIKHIPKITYHWRLLQTSTATSTDAKPYVLEAQKKAVEEHLTRINRKAEVIINKEISQLKVNYLLEAKPKISVIIPTKDRIDLLQTAIKSVTDTNYPNLEILVVSNNSSEEKTFNYFNNISDPRIKVIYENSDFNYSKLNNIAAKQADGEYLLLLNNDIQSINNNWLEKMLSFNIQKNIAITGAKLIWSNELFQHCGIILGIGDIAGHSHKGLLRSDFGYFNRIILNQDISAVTGACLLIKKSIYFEVNGLDEINLPVSFNDVDLCLKVREKGYKVVYVADSELYHHESLSRGYEDTPEKVLRAEHEIKYMKEKWGNLLKNDPYYNPNLTLVTEDFRLAFPPRKI